MAAMLITWVPIDKSEGIVKSALVLAVRSTGDFCQRG
jgi:hypothetical protein